MLGVRTGYLVLVMSTEGVFDHLLASGPGGLYHSGYLGIRVRGIRPRQDGRLGRVLGLAQGVCRYS